MNLREHCDEEYNLENECLSLNLINPKYETGQLSLVYILFEVDQF